MRVFGKTTKTQLTVLGLALTVLGAVGAFGVMFMPNETPASLIDSPDKIEYFSGTAIWSIFAFLLVAMTGLLLLGTGLTGLPLVHLAKYHTGVFYVGVFSLLLIPTAIALKSGATLVGNAMCDTMFAETLTGDVYSSPAGMLALVIGFVILGISVFVIITNLLTLGKVAYRPSLVKGAAVIGVTLSVLLIVTYTTVPMLMAFQFEHGHGRQGAVGFEGFPPMDVTYSPGWLGWLSDGESSSTYGSMSNWLGMMSFMLLIAVIVTIVGFIGLALYSANDRSSNATNLTLTPLASMVFLVLSLLFYFGYNGALNMMAGRLNVDSEITRITYLSGNMSIVLVLMLIAIGAGIGYALTLREWLSSMFSGKKAVDPISMTSLVDAPTGLLDPPTGWPANWSRMSTSNIAIVSVAALLVIAGFGSGYYVKGKENTSSDFNPTNNDDLVDLDELSDEQRSFTFSDYAAEGGTRAFLWQPDGIWFIKRMELVVTWTDEEPFFRHENLPDTFQGTINCSNGEGAIGEGSSSSTTQSELRCIVEFDNYILMTSVPGLNLPPEVETADITVNITCVEAGDQVPIGTGFLEFADDGNT
ncbi:MAG: hypothetical protein LN414_06500, partial [Candidatus Thermoplasmatota archaeon]|nr:hypothetical protein [Candidatus Thermoplasmatota archaeon]